MTAELLAPRLLTAHDRCDTKECGSQAYIRALVKGSELLFCGHHGRKNMAKLCYIGAQIDDQTSRLALEGAGAR